MMKPPAKNSPIAHPHAASSRRVAVTTAYVGPIPPPETLAKHEELQTGLAERIVSMAEIQSEHRRQLEAANVSSNTTYRCKR